MASYKLIGPNVVQIRENDAKRTAFKKVTDIEKKEIKSMGYDLFPTYFQDEDFIHVAIRKNSKTI